MREIKFKAAVFKLINPEKVNELDKWEFEKIIDNPWGYGTEGLDRNAFNLNKWLKNPMSDTHHKYILIQYTGLKDKNGKEIYEGDILRGADIYKYEIINYNGCFGFWHWSLRDDGNNRKGFCPLYDLNDLWQEQIEIIGNIYENQGLKINKW